MSSYSPQSLSVIASFLTAISLMLLMLAMKLSDSLFFVWWMLLLLPLIVFLTSYLIMQYFVSQYIQARISLIYRTISEFRSARSSSDFTIDAKQDVISTVENEVYRWTQNKRKEIKEQKKQEKYRREFVSNVSHELKTPIFSIEGYIETLLDGGINDPEINIKYLEKALSNTERLSEILKDLDMISSLQGDGIELDFESIDLLAIIQEVMDSLQFLSHSYQVEVSMRSAITKKVFVIADRHRIKQVLTNLISNAIKYGNKGGVVEIEVFDMDEHMLVEVRDNGIGIEKQHLPHLFERFYRVDKNRSRVMGGTGLGLAIVKHIMEAHEQTINVRSTKGVGSTFGFTLRTY
jgi:two-component system, OmpR family, phosphate regulon sensor histidine kinase PhoR